MNLYRLGAIPWDETQAIYHALAQNRQEGLVICRPAGRCVCLGLHDDLEQEVDLAYCRENNIPVIRRDIGGGMVLLAEEQIFFQLVLRADNPLLTGRREAFFGQLLQPAIRTLGDFAIPAAVKLPADVVVNGKKISGNGAGDINGFAVYTGNILLAFDRTAMANVLKVPGSRFRDQLRLSLERYLTTMEEELGCLPEYEAVEARLVHHFAAWLELTPAEYTAALRAGAAKTARYLTSPEFLQLPGKRSRVRQVKINEGTYVRLQPFPRCLKPTPDSQNACGNRNGSCAGYAILVLQNNTIIEFAHYGPACLEPSRLQLLASLLAGCAWHEQAVKPVVAEWICQAAGGAAGVLPAVVADWILAR